MKILGVCASSRDKNQSMILLDVVLSSARDVGADAEILNLLETPLPLFRADGAYDQEYPIINKVQRMCSDADAFVLVTPEYHARSAVRWRQILSGNRARNRNGQGRDHERE